MQNFRVRGDTLLNVVYDTRTGKNVRAESLALDNDEGLKLRELIMKQIHRGDPLFKCPDCNKSVKLRSSIDKSGQYFVHEVEEGNCPYLQGKGYSQDKIRALRYHGQKESRAHKDAKTWLKECLEADPHFSNVVVEKRFTCSKDSKNYRVPDVRATLHRPEGDIVVAFEIQLSSTFLTEIVGRREFYLDEGALLVWVSRNFEKDDPKMTQHDIVAPNNMNAFVIDKETHAKSLAEHELFMNCHWAQPSLDTDEISLSQTFHSRIVSFHELKLNQEMQHAIFYDYENEKAKLKIRIEKQAERLIVDRYLEWCAHPAPSPDDALEVFIRLCRQKGINFPRNKNKIVAVTQHLASAKAGVPVGHGFHKLIECAHQVFENHKPFFFYFRAACTYYERDQLLKEQDAQRNRPWETPGLKGKIGQAWKLMQQSGSIKEFYDDSFRELMLFIFPEIELALEQKVAATLRSIGGH